jgi:FkbM family methyltransferase
VIRRVFGHRDLSDEGTPAAKPDLVLQSASDTELIREIVRRAKDPAQHLLSDLVARLPAKVLVAMLSGVSDQRLARELARRTTESRLAETVDGAVVAELALALESSNLLDYRKHDIRLVTSSPASRKRLWSVRKEPFTVDWLERSLAPGDVFYDIGANVGAFTLIAGKLLGSNGKVVAFEPGAPTFHDLCRNILLNGCERFVMPLPILLWSATAVTDFSYRTMIAGDAQHRVAEHQTDEEPVYRQPMLAFSLDDLIGLFRIPLPTIAKIDVDGSESELLKGSVKTLQSHRLRSLLIEVDSTRSASADAEHVVTQLADAGLEVIARHSRTATSAVYLEAVRDSG